MVKPEAFYDALSAEYDLFVDWPARLAHELPFLLRLLERHRVHTVLDVACGTGKHAIALAQRGYQVVGADSSSAMLQCARHNAAREGVEVSFIETGFGGLRRDLREQFDAVICLGNSLPHLTDQRSLSAALQDIHAVLKPGGLFVEQSRNFDRVLAEHERFMAPQAAQRGNEEWLFIRFYDMNGSDLLFNMMRLHRSDGGEWSWRVESTPLRAWRQHELLSAFAGAALLIEGSFGGLDGSPFEIQSSPDLVLVAVGGP